MQFFFFFFFGGIIVFYNFYFESYEMLVDWEIKQQRSDTNGRTFLFDMGASLYNAGSGGASQAWFVDIFFLILFL
jgi:hypothetical protein